MEALPVPTFHVVATTVEGTEAALRVAASLAKAQGGRIVLLISLADATGTAPDGWARSSEWVIAHYEHIAHRLDQAIQIRVCDCANSTEAAKRMTPPRAAIVIGGDALWFWPSAEQRLAARLRRSGREVIFVGCNSE
jgi:hypothetical protein